MAKLYFRYGCVSSGKSLELINIASSYKAQGKHVVVLKPAIDTRFGVQKIRSRTGLGCEVDFQIESADDVLEAAKSRPAIILVDEAQFLDSLVIEQLRLITIHNSIPIICFGLRTDFRGRLFAGSQRLLELSDRIEEVKSICFYCQSKASFNLRLRNGLPDFSGPVIQLGANESYQAVCASHYFEFSHNCLKDAQNMSPDSDSLRL